MEIGKILLVAGILSLMVPGVTAQTGPGTERFLLKGNSPIRVYIESGWKRDGLTPLILDISGVSLSLFMDAEGRVGDEMIFESSRDGKTSLRGTELFRLDVENGKLQSGDRTLSGEVYELNNLRTRLRLNAPAAALDLNVVLHRATLELNGFKIPIRVHLAPEVDGVRKLDIGNSGNHGDSRLFLDVKQGRLLSESSRPNRLNMMDAAGRECWAEKQK
jgi:hypothetical protein